MCYALFIAADVPLPVDDSFEIDDGFRLESPQPQHSPVLANFSKPYVYYAASWQGCGCGWFPDVALFERPKSRQKSRAKTAQSLRDLGALLSDLLTRSESAELFLTWEGEVGEPVTDRIALTPADFETDALPMQQGTLAVVTRATG